jgi:2-polyprenyl-3-methyl-5-hydroxy-6-metoxy-1,4-benzoquinol methylase
MFVKVMYAAHQVTNVVGHNFVLVICSDVLHHATDYVPRFVSNGFSTGVPFEKQE